MSAPIKTSQRGFYNIGPDFLHSEGFLRKIKLSHLQPGTGDYVLAAPHPAPGRPIVLRPGTEVALGEVVQDSRLS